MWRKGMMDEILFNMRFIRLALIQAWQSAIFRTENKQTGRGFRQPERRRQVLVDFVRGGMTLIRERAELAATRIILLTSGEQSGDLLHFVGSAFAIEDVPRFSAAFAFAPLWFLAAAYVGADPVAADNLLFGRSHGFFLLVRHFQSLDSGLVNTGIDAERLLYRKKTTWLRTIIAYPSDEGPCNAADFVPKRTVSQWRQVRKSAPGGGMRFRKKGWQPFAVSSLSWPSRRRPTTRAGSTKECL